MHSRLRITEMEGIKLSILILTHNRPKLLEKAVESVARGDIRDVEVVILNTGEPFNPPDKWKVDYYYNPRLELTESYEFLIQKAKGEYSVFLEDDDRLIFNTIWDNILRYEHDLYLFNNYVNDEIGHKFVTTKIWSDQEFNSRELLQKIPKIDSNGEYHLGQLVFKTDLAQAIEFPDSNCIGMDEYFLYKLLTLACSAMTCSQPSYMATVHGNNLSWNNPQNIIDSGSEPMHLVYKDVVDFIGEDKAKEWATNLKKIYEKKLHSARAKLYPDSRTQSA